MTRDKKGRFVSDPRAPITQLPDDVPSPILEGIDFLLSGVPEDQVDGYREMAIMYARSVAVTGGWESVETLLSTVKTAAAHHQAGDYDLARQNLAAVEGGEMLYAALVASGPDAQ